MSTGEHDDNDGDTSMRDNCETQELHSMKPTCSILAGSKADRFKDVQHPQGCKA